MKKYTFCFLFLPSLMLGQSDELRSTGDLSFLLGDWAVERTYHLGAQSPRTLEGSLSCRFSLDNQFIQCTYETGRPGLKSVLDEVYFDFNSIYGLYESLWLSSTWPVKVLLQGNLIESEHSLLLKTEAQFLIENEVTEFVRDELTTQSVDRIDFFSRETFIRTSADKDAVWRHHMTEIATRKN